MKRSDQVAAIADASVLVPNRNMTQEELADYAGLSARYIGAIERADVSASVTVLGQIAKALKVEPGELVKSSDRPR